MICFEVIANDVSGTMLQTEAIEHDYTEYVSVVAECVVKLCDCVVTISPMDSPLCNEIIAQVCGNCILHIKHYRS
jgi:hypothetical protein